MYRLTKKLFDFLLEHSKEIGLIDPNGAVGADNEYVLEQDYKTKILCKDDDSQFYFHKHKPEVCGYWLWRKCDLTYGDLPIMEIGEEGEREAVVEGVLVKSPSTAHKKYEATFIQTLDELLRLEPELKKYVNLPTKAAG